MQSPSRSVFVSYARSDGDFALQLARDLKSAGLAAWIDQIDIPPGDRWDAAIEKTLRQSECVVVVLSRASVQSANVMDEVSFALDEQKRVLPVLMEECSIPMRLRRLQFIDFSSNRRDALVRLLDIFGATSATNTASSMDQRQSEPKGVGAGPSEPTRAGENTAREPISPSVAAMPRASRRAKAVFAATLVAMIGLAIWSWLAHQSTVDQPDAPKASVSSPTNRTPKSIKDERLRNYKIDVFWCDESGQAAMTQATEIKDYLSLSFELARLRVQKLVLGKGPWASGYEIRVDPDGSEDKAGKLLQQQLAERFPRYGFTGWTSWGATPNYLSVFVCPGAQSDETLDGREQHF
jgi:hypothetical protein